MAETSNKVKCVCGENLDNHNDLDKSNVQGIKIGDVDFLTESCIYARK